MNTAHQQWQRQWQQRQQWAQRQYVEQQARARGYNSAWESLSPAAQAFQIVTALVVIGFIAVVAVTVLTAPTP